MTYRPLGTACTKSPGAAWVALSGITVQKGETLWLCIAADHTDWDHLYITWKGRTVRWYGPVWLYVAAETETGDLIVTPTDPSAVIALTACAIGTDQVGNGSSQGGNGDLARMTLQAGTGPVIEIMMLATKGPVSDTPASSFPGSVQVGQRIGTMDGEDDSNWTVQEFYREHIGSGFEMFNIGGFTPRSWYTDNASNPVSSPPVNLPPTLTITSPKNGSLLPCGTVKFSGTALDAEDKNISDKIQWSNGVVGAGATMNYSCGGPGIGAKLITATVTDSGGLMARASVSFTIRKK